jgi:hypothetical protein
LPARLPLLNFLKEAGCVKKNIAQLRNVAGQWVSVIEIGRHLYFHR